MALNQKITSKIKEKAGNDDFLRINLIKLLTRVDEGRQAKRTIEDIMKEIK